MLSYNYHLQLYLLNFRASGLYKLKKEISIQKCKTFFYDEYKEVFYILKALIIKLNIDILG